MVEKVLISRGRSYVAYRGNSVRIVRRIQWTIRAFIHAALLAALMRSRVGDMQTHVLLAGIRCKFTRFPHVLRIQFLPNFNDLFANQEIKFNCPLNFVDRMNCSGMIFAPELLGDARKTHMQLAAQ